MKFNPEINLGTLIEIATFLLVVLGAVRKIGALETKLDLMYGWFQRNVINDHITAERTPSGRRRVNGASL